MKSTNADIADFRARKRTRDFSFPEPREIPTWAEPREESGLLRFIVTGLAVTLGVILCLAFWARVADDVKHEEWARQTAADCVADGKTPHVDRDAQDKVLSVRCQP